MNLSKKNQNKPKTKKQKKQNKQNKQKGGLYNNSPSQYKKLQNYQRDTVNRITKKCDIQKGFIIFHEMGSGKTLTGLSIMQHYLNSNENFGFGKYHVYPQNVILICSEEIQNVWRSESAFIPQLVQDENNHDYLSKIFRSYQSFLSMTEEDFNNKLIIVDEAHNIARLINHTILHKNNQESSINEIIKKMRFIKKIVMLTGTPIYENLIDLSILVNICAQKEIIPYSPDLFRSDYMVLKNNVKLWYGHIYPIIQFFTNNINRIINFFTPNTKQQLSFALLYTLLERKNIIVPEIASLITKNKNILIIYAIASFFKNVLKMYDNTNIHSLGKFGVKAKPILKNFGPYIDYYKPPELPKKEFQNMYVPYNFYQLFEWFKMAIGIIDNPDRYNDNQIHKHRINPIYIEGTNFINNINPKENDKADPHHARFFKNNDLYDIGRIIGNTTFNIWDIIIPTIMKYIQDVRNMQGPDAFTQENIKIWLNMKKKNTENADQAKEKLNEVLGYLPLNQKVKKKIISSANAIIDSFYTNKQKPSRYSRVTGISFDPIPSKFLHLSEFIVNKPGCHLIYSNFYDKGALLIFEFLKETLKNSNRYDIQFLDINRNGKNNTNIKHLTQDFFFQKKDEQKTKVLILHPKYSEGISIKGTNFFHILEPIKQFSKYEQTVGRAVRFDSHLHLSEKDRKVNIINWICEMPASAFGSIEFVRQLFYSQVHFYIFMQHFLKDVSILKYLFDNVFPNSTPDQIVFNSNDELHIFKNAIENVLSRDDIKACEDNKEEYNNFVNTNNANNTNNTNNTNKKKIEKICKLQNVK